MSTMRTYLAVGIGLLLLAGCGGGSKALKGGQLKETIELNENAGEWIEAMGMGAADPNLPTLMQRRATSRNAAVVDAQYQLAGKIKGVQVVGGITVQKAIETDSKIQTSVDAMVKGAEVVKLEYDKEDGCVATLRIHKKIVEKELGIKIK